VRPQRPQPTEYCISAYLTPFSALDRCTFGGLGVTTRAILFASFLCSPSLMNLMVASNLCATYSADSVTKGASRETAGHIVGRRALTIQAWVSSEQTQGTKVVLSGISFLPSWPTSIIRRTSYIGAVFLIFSTPSDSGGPGSSHPRFFQVSKSLEVPDFKRFLRHLPVSFPPSLGLFSCRALSGGPRQGGNPSHHHPEQPPRQTAFRQHQPVVPRVLDQPAAGLHQPLLPCTKGRRRTGC